MKRDGRGARPVCPPHPTPPLPPPYTLLYTHYCAACHDFSPHNSCIEHIASNSAMQIFTLLLEPRRPESESEGGCCNICMLIKQKKKKKMHLCFYSRLCSALCLAADNQTLDCADTGVYVGKSELFIRTQQVIINLSKHWLRGAAPPLSASRSASTGPVSRRSSLEQRPGYLF